MLENLVMLQSYYGYYGGQIGDFLNVLAEQGFFAYVLPFLLIFALVHGILMKINLFGENKAIAGIIALSVGLMALQWDIVPAFFSVIFPKLGVGLAILLVVIILGGMFFTQKPGMNYSLLGIAAVIVITVLIQTAGDLGWSAGYWWYDNWPFVAGIVVFLILIAIIVGGSAPKDNSGSSVGKLLSDMFGGKGH